MNTQTPQVSDDLQHMQNSDNSQAVSIYEIDDFYLDGYEVIGNIYEGVEVCT